VSILDVDIRLAVQDRQRRFELDLQFQSDSPVLALFGPSGAGKSLSLQAMAGLLKPSSGHVRLGGRTLFDAAQGINVPPARRRIGYLFQDYALFPHLSVRANIGFGLSNWLCPRPSPADTEWVNTLLQRFELASMAEAKPAKLSGGQQQRVALARALACRPELLLLDEPFAALNPLLRQGLRQELKRLREEWQIPIVMISHDVEDVLALADRALVIEQGRVLREIDLHSAEASERLAPPRTPAHPHEARLRGLLKLDG